jgi:hypothetical protein
VTILETRGQVLHPCARRMAQHLTHWADERGRLVNIPAMLDAYAARHDVGRRTAWHDFMERLVKARLVRQVFAAAPGRPARYVLAMDLVTSLPDDLPADLAAEVRKFVDDPIAAAKGRTTRAGEDATLAECEVIREGSATGPKIASRLGCGRLHTSPYTREGSPPSPQPQPSRATRRPLSTLFSGQDLNEEKAAALDFVKILTPDWARQRGGQVLSEAEMAELAHLVALLLRHVPRREAAELLTVQVASAADLAGVLRWRIGRTLAGLRRAARRSEAIRVDDDGVRHAAFLAANAARAEAQAATKAAIVAQARQLARQAAERRERGADARLDARLQPGRHGGHSAAESSRSGSGGGEIPPARRLYGVAEPEEIFRRDVTERHATSQAGGLRLTEPEPERTAGADDPAAVEAERQWLIRMMAARRSDS